MLFRYIGFQGKFSVNETVYRFLREIFGFWSYRFPREIFGFWSYWFSRGRFGFEAISVSEGNFRFFSYRFPREILEAIFFGSFLRRQMLQPLLRVPTDKSLQCCLEHRAMWSCFNYHWLTLGTITKKISFNDRSWIWGMLCHCQLKLHIWKPWSSITTLSRSEAVLNTFWRSILRSSWPAFLLRRTKSFMLQWYSFGLLTVCTTQDMMSLFGLLIASIFAYLSKYIQTKGQAHGEPQWTKFPGALSWAARPILSIGIFFGRPRTAKITNLPNAGYEVGNAVLDEISTHLAAQATDVYINGVECMEVGTLRLVWVALEGDLPAQARACHLKRNFNCMPNQLCPWCLADDHEVPFSDYRQNATWRATSGTQRPWTTESPFHGIPGGDNELFLAKDLFHLCHLGAVRGFAINLLCYMCWTGVWDPCHSQMHSIIIYIYTNTLALTYVSSQMTGALHIWIYIYIYTL